jgi:hypothetical protein
MMSCASMSYIPSTQLINTANKSSPNHRWRIIISLAITTVIRTLLVIISFGCKVPAGIFVPSMAIGAAFGRMVGIAVQVMHESFPSAAFFSACEPDGPCITPGTYAFLGAAAALSGIMHITVSVVVIMFEITGALDYILPTMIVVGVTKAVSERFGHGGIADRMITLNGYPFLDTKTDTSFGVPVSTVMSTTPISLPAASAPSPKHHTRATRSSRTPPRTTSSATSAAQNCNTHSPAPSQQTALRPAPLQASPPPLPPHHTHTLPPNPTQTP